MCCIILDKNTQTIENYASVYFVCADVGAQRCRDRVASVVLGITAG